MIINSDALAILHKNIPLPILQRATDCADCIVVDLSAETMSGIIDPDYLIGEDYPFMLIDTDEVTYQIFCWDPDISPRWSISANLSPLQLDNEKILALLDEAYTTNTTDLVCSMIMETEDAGVDCVSFDLILSPEEQRTIFDLAGINKYQQDYILRLQNV